MNAAFPDDVAALWEELDARVPPLMRSYRARVESLTVGIKADTTLLTEADLAVEDLIVDLIRRVDPSARIVTEERPESHAVPSWKGRVWIVDPIDGTAQFVEPNQVEYCSVVVTASDGVPDACWVVAPQLCRDGEALTVKMIRPESGITVNGKRARVFDVPPGSARASATRSAGDPARSFETVARRAGLELKTRTTSQTIDQIRTCVDLYDETGLDGFAWFYRRDQKLWDGVVGLAFARLTGRVAIDDAGEPLLPLRFPVNARGGPTFVTSLLVPEWYAPETLKLLAAR